MQCRSLASLEPMFTLTTKHMVIEFPELMPDCPEMKTFKIFSDQKRIVIPMMRRRDVRFIWPLTL